MHCIFFFLSLEAICIRAPLANALCVHHFVIGEHSPLLLNRKNSLSFSSTSSLILGCDRRKVLLRHRGLWEVLLASTTSIVTGAWSDHMILWMSAA